MIQRPATLLAGGIRSGSATKIFLLFFLAFLPLGIIALLGVVQSFRTTGQERDTRLQLSVEQHARRLTRVIAEDRRLLLFLVESSDKGTDGTCKQAATTLFERETGRLSFVVFDRSGKQLCASADSIPPSATMSPRLETVGAGIDTAGQRLLVSAHRSDKGLLAIGSYSREAITQIIGAPSIGDRTLVLEAGQERLMLGDGSVTPREGRISVSTQMDLGLRMTESMVSPPVTALALFMLLLPIILWLIAAAIAWYSVHRLLVRPLVAMQRAVATYRPGHDPEPIRQRSAFFDEINVLGQTFHDMVQDVSRHEQQMVDSLDRQRKLTREVHHRVKNNLQIITSLVSLHSRSAKNPDAAIAYASIQRRVDALAVVHRNHFAEIEQNEGVHGSALINELASSLRGGGADLGGSVALRVDCDQIMLDQDVAMPVAFIVTELVELAIRVDAHAPISLSFKHFPPAGKTAPTSATLSVQSAALVASPALEALIAEGFERVLRGLSRQLRGELVWDGNAGNYAIRVAILA